MTNDVKNTLLEQLERYLQKTRDAEHGLTVKKLWNRDVDCRVEDGKLVFYMDRHHPVACGYVKGCPMEAFVETKETYVFDPIAQTIENSGSEFVRVEADYDKWADSQIEEFKPTVTRIGPRRFLYHPAWGKETIVTSYRQAADLVEEDVSNWNLRDLLCALDDHMIPQEVDDVADRLLDACVNKALSNFRAEWEEMLAKTGAEDLSKPKAKRKTKKN